VFPTRELLDEKVLLLEVEGNSEDKLPTDVTTLADDARALLTEDDVLATDEELVATEEVATGGSDWLLELPPTPLPPQAAKLNIMPTIQTALTTLLIAIILFPLWIHPLSLNPSSLKDPVQIAAKWCCPKQVKI
jgi:hypothetical protein